MKSRRMKTQAEAFRVAHNRASKLYKAAFKAVGARMWQGDDCHELPKFSTEFQMKQLENGVPADALFFASRPLTILDSFPQVTNHQRKELEKLVERIYQSFQLEVQEILS